MEREIKFSYILKKDNGEFSELIFDYDDIFDGKTKKFLNDLGYLIIVAKRQYTGLKDKNRNEIYDGDILKISKTDIVKVIWDNQTAGFNTEPRIEYADWGWDEAVTDHINRIEKIGNIYKNPELLNQ